MDKLQKLEEWLLEKIEHHKTKEAQCIALVRTDAATIHHVRWSSYENVLIKIAEIKIA